MMKRPRRAGLHAALVLLVVLVPAAQAGEPKLGDMPSVRIDVDGRLFTARLAATAAHRAAGFQHVAPADMAGEAIYFAYDRPRRPAFHMRNVAKPLLLAWIAPDGRVRRIIRMEPGSSGHRPPGPVSAVLEFTASHPLADHAGPGSTVTLVADPAPVRNPRTGVHAAAPGDRWRVVRDAP